MTFENLAQSATERLGKLKFEPLDEGGGERHGAWEWTWVKPRDGGGRCYTSLSAVKLVAGPFTIEVRAGADNGLRFGRVQGRKFEAVADSDLSEGLSNTILSRLEGAAEKACRLSEDDLKDSYPRATSRL